MKKTFVELSQYNWNQAGFSIKLRAKGQAPVFAFGDFVFTIPQLKVLLRKHTHTFTQTSMQEKYSMSYTKHLLRRLRALNYNKPLAELIYIAQRLEINTPLALIGLQSIANSAMAARDLSSAPPPPQMSTSLQ